MKIDLRSKWWTAGAILFGSLFIVWSIFLLIVVNRQQEAQRENAGTIDQLNQLEDYVEKTSVDMLDSNVDDFSKFRLGFRALTFQLEKNPLISKNIALSIIYFNRLDSIEHTAIEKNNLTEFLKDGKFSSEEAYKAIQQIESALGIMLAEQAEISADLSLKWHQLYLLVIIACLVVSLIYFLLRLTQKSIQGLIESKKEIKNVNIFLDLVLENIPDMVFIKDAKELRFVRLNKAAEEIIGIPEKDMVGKNDYDFFPKDQAAFFTDKDRAVLAGNKMVDIPEESIDTKHLGKRWLHSKKLPLFLGKDKPAFLLGISRDITEQKQHIDEIKKFNEELERQVHIRTVELEQANNKLLIQINERYKAEEVVRQSEQKYEMLINNIEEGIVYTDIEGKILFVNWKFCEMTSYNPDELLGTYGEKIVTDEAGRKKINEVAEERKKGLKGSYELNITKKSGEELRVYITGVPIKDKSGNIIGTLGSHLDITHIRNTEKKLIEKMNDLNMFFYRASHDLKGPLSSMQGLLSLATKQITDSTALNYVSMLNQSVDKLDKVLLGLIEVLNITQGEMKPEKVNIQELVGKIVDSFNQLPEREGIRIEQHIHIDKEIFVDKNVLRSALQNLIHNAISYRKKEFQGAFIEISANMKIKGMEIRICDNGVGIPKSLEKKVFDIFFRANADSPGSGLGLYIVKSAIEKINSTITMSSEVGVGTEFIIDIPIIES